MPTNQRFGWTTARWMAALFATLPLQGEVSHRPSPEWRDAVIYMVMLDRFYDGDPSNNDQGFGEYQKGSPHHFNGGDFAGLRRQIPYLRELGINAVWITPPVLNQWWSEPYQAAGWHGYWAVNFRQTDPHFGSLDEYRALARELHDNGIALIQDIVVNHTANFFTYDNNYDPSDTARNFRLLAPDHPTQARPTQEPFHLIDRLDPAQAAANIYHWTPSIQDNRDRQQELTWSLGMLADLNTSNPRVLAALKDSYRFWIREVGVDAFRIDTVKYVEHAFWHHFLNDPDGIHPYAADLGKENFLTFGEVFEGSAPFEANGEEKIISYLGTPRKPQLRSMLGFPLYFDIHAVFAEGRPPAQLAFRIQTMMERYPDPFIVPNFIDNHDTKRFLAAGSQAGFRQALALLFSLPGIPVLLQGTEQALEETRQALFAGGVGTEQDLFATDSATYRYIRQLTALRAAQRTLRRGSLTVLAAEQNSPGLLAFVREEQNRRLLFLANTANHAILAHQVPAAMRPGATAPLLLSENFTGSLQADPNGSLTISLPARAVLLADISNTPNSERPPQLQFSIQSPTAGEVLREDTLLSGTVSPTVPELHLIIDGNLDQMVKLAPNATGRWIFRLPVRDLGQTARSLRLFEPLSGQLSAPHPFSTELDQAGLTAILSPHVPDPSPAPAAYELPRQPASSTQKEIVQAQARASGANLEISLQMKSMTQIWNPANGFDNVAFSIFFSFPNRQEGTHDLPLLNARMPGKLQWQLGHVAFGWGNFLFSSTNATASRRGERLGVAPALTVDPHTNTLRILYRGTACGVQDWNGVTIHITTWDMNGEGDYLEIKDQPGDWHFSSPQPAHSPKIFHQRTLTLSPAKSD